MCPLLYNISLLITFSLKFIIGKLRVEACICIFRYRKIHNSLNLYKNGVLRKTMLAIGNFHRSALATQRFLIRGIGNSFKETWQDHIKILVSLFAWMTKLLGLFGCTEFNDTDVDTPIPTNVPLINMTDPLSTEMSDYSRNNNKNTHVAIRRRKDCEYFSSLLHATCFTISILYVLASIVLNSLTGKRFALVLM